MSTQIQRWTNVRFTSSVVATQRGMALFGCADASVVLVSRTCTATYCASRCHDALTPTPGNQCLAVEKLLLKAADLAASLFASVSCLDIRACAWSPTVIQ